MSGKEQQLIDETRCYLHQHGYKLTPQREAIIRVLMNEKDHLSAEEIYSCVKQEHANIGLATVYRTLEMMTEMKIVDKVQFEDQMVRYEWRRHHLSHAHHHLYCKECGDIIEIEDDLIGMIAPLIQEKYGFKVDDLPLSFYGDCKNCHSDKE